MSKRNPGNELVTNEMTSSNRLLCCCTIELLERDLGRMGIKLDDAISDPAKTAFAIDKEFESRTNFVRSIQKQAVARSA